MGKLLISILIINIAVWAASPDQLVKEGIVLRQAGKLDSAIVKFQEVIKSKPKHAEANFELGQTYLEKGDYEPAIKYLQNALTYGYNPTKTHLTLAKAYRAGGSRIDATLEYKLVLETNPNNPEIHTLLGDTYLEGGNSTLAEKEYKDALTIDPQYIPAMINLANFFQNKRQYEDALALYEKAKVINPNYAPTYLSLGTYYSSQKLYDKALVEFTKYTTLLPKDPQGYAKLADIHSRMKDYTSAINEMHQVFNYGDTAVGSLKFLRHLYIQTKQILEEKEALKQIVAKVPNEVSNWLDLAKVYTKLDSFQGTIYAYNQALAVDSTILTNIIFDLGLAYYQVAKYDSSELIFSEKIERDSLATGAYFNRALARIQLKKYSEAISDLEKGLKIKPDHVQGHLWLGQVYAFQGMKQKAKDEFKTVLKLDPKNKVAQKGLDELNKPPPKDYYDYYPEDDYYPDE